MALGLGVRYLLLDEMIDSGLPFTTESNRLEDAEHVRKRWKGMEKPMMWCVLGRFQRVLIDF